MLDPDEKLWDEGSSSYLEALQALHEYRKLVLAGCREVVVSRLADLSDALCTSIIPENAIKDHVYPQDYKNWFDDAAWLAVKVEFDKLTLYCGLLWMTDGQETWPKIVAMVAPKTREVEHMLWRTANDFGPPGPRRFFPMEISFWGAMSANSLADFPDRLNCSIERWIRVWKDGRVKESLQLLPRF